MQLHLYVMLAEQERRFISERTKNPLKSLRAKAENGDTDAIMKIARREEKLSLGRTKLNRPEGHETQRQQAVDRAANLQDTIELCILKSADSFQAVANRLRSRNIPTAQGGPWSATTAMRPMKRLVLTLRKEADLL